jgi:hypothetical protein
MCLKYLMNTVCYGVLEASNKQNNRQAVLFIQVIFRILPVASSLFFLIDKEVEPVIQDSG